MSMDNQLIIREGEEQGSVKFHRHCQKTVCSAYGYDGSGKTWDILRDAYDSETLPNLKDNWIDEFTVNTQNIT